MSAVVDLHRALVRIPSVNPDGDPGTDRTGEAECAQFLADLLTSHGAEAELREVLPGRPNILASFPADRPGKPRLLFAPHTDTVSVGGMTIPPFAGEELDGRIWGRGASDTKGPMAAMLQALIQSKDILPRRTHEIWFAGLMGEEAGQHGSRALAQSEKFDFVIVGEPTELRVVHTHKGSLWLKLQAHGQSVHASMPERGRNAIEPVMEAMLFLREEFGRRFADLRHPVLGAPSFNIGTIRGGSKVNIVPDACEAWVDSRTLPDQDIEPWIAAARERFPQVEFSVYGSKPLYTDPGHKMISVLESCGAPLTGAPWFCDAAVFAEEGIPAVAIGPGCMLQAHTADEWISIADLEAGVTFFEKFLHQLIPA